jgi:hypothetical protein
MDVIKIAAERVQASFDQELTAVNQAIGGRIQIV